MANDWIKMRTDLYRDPKVCVMAELLMCDDSDLARYVSQNTQCNISVTRNVTRNAVVGALLSVWGVMRHRGKRVGNDLVCKNATLYVIDDIADLPGIGAAMVHVNWAEERDDCLVFQGFFDEYNTEPDRKTKSKNAERQQRYRDKKASERNAVSDATRDVTVTPREERRREEKRREDKRTTTTTAEDSSNIKFAMHRDWVPSDNFQDCLLDSGITRKWHDFVSEFILYRMGEQNPRLETQLSWESIFLKSIRRAVVMEAKWERKA